MGKSLVIVESPAKAKTINKYLGNEYVVKSSIGHIRDLPTSGSASASKEPAAKRGKAAACHQVGFTAKAGIGLFEAVAVKNISAAVIASRIVTSMSR